MLPKIEICNWKDNKIIFYCLISLIVLWRIPFLNKGIDYTDTGFNLTNYSYFLDNEYPKGIGLFMTNIIGSVIYNSINSYHLLIFRIIHYVLGLITTFFAYKLLNKYIKINLLLAILLVLSFWNKDGEAIYSYYPMTCLLLFLSLWLLHEGIIFKKNFFIFISGIFCGINVFFRIPNVLFICLGISIFYYDYLKNESIKYIAKRFIMYFIGASIGFCIDVIIMSYFINLYDFFDSLLGMIKIGIGYHNNITNNTIGIEEIEDAHSLFVLMKCICKQIVKAGILCCLFFPFSFIINRIKIYVQGKSYFRSFEIIIFITICMIFFILTKQKYINTWHDLICLISLVLFVFLVYNHKSINLEHSLLYITAIMLSFFSVIGSDLGLYRLGIIRQLIIPLLILAINDLYAIYRDENDKINININILNSFVLLLYIGMTIIGILILIPKTYMDDTYSKLDTYVNKEIIVLLGMKTTKERADSINEFYSVMQRNEFKDLEMAVFGYYPLAFVLSANKNYFYQIQPCIDYSSVKVYKLLNVIEKNKKLPLIVISHVNQNRNKSSHFTSKAKEAVLQYMLKQGDYTIEYESKNFTIYYPLQMNNN